ncbi:MAG: glycerol-3-phosphate 1-O-acyltransferase PlsY [Gemmatimonadota bacterium]|nr:glycerol-3-phosphate 1-O-acyltransferase PlsY [Gemmatimonadota bacterium]MDE3005073.1 glycerol-3-phosphate 1-O-acyltransferase PlsY [Gemmatimonadota bacterium]MDE3013809.1 glycerol-3-phosphate 1-O-acyltransferase PlsY [Gemmatimonadota bacterium]
MVWVLLALSYLIGATPTSYWVGRAVHGLDLREHGSGNLGATNALRVLGWKSAVPVVVVDIAKGWAPAALFPAVAGVAFPWSFAFGVAAILGHMCSPWVGFKGGKGMATGAGVFLALAPMAVGMGFLIWLVITWVTGYVSLASISVAAALPPLIAFTPHEGGVTLVWLTTVLAVFIVWKHRSNIGRLMRGEENRFRRAAESGVTAEEAP